MLGLTLLLWFISIALSLQIPGAYVPPHIPMQNVAPTVEFEIPWWLGGFVANVNESSTWVLPLTYPNGGKTNLGTVLIIQNQGPYNITLYAQGSETIQGIESYLIIADTTVTFLSAVDWVVVSNTFGGGQDGIFGYIRAENASIKCRLSVGPDTPANTDCGDLTANRAVVGDVTLDPWAAIKNIGQPIVGTIGTYQEYADNGPGNIFQLASTAENNGSRPTVAGFFYARGKHSFGINEAGYSLGSDHVAIGNELDFGNLATSRTALTTGITLPLAGSASISVTSTAGYDIGSGFGVLVIDGNFYTYASATATTFDGLVFLEGSNTGTYPTGTRVTYGIGGSAYGLVIVALGGNIGGSPPNTYVQLQANVASQPPTGIRFNGVNRPSVSKNGKLIVAADENCVSGVDLTGSRFSSGALLVDVNSGSTAPSRGVHIRTAGGFDNTGSALRIEGVSGTVGTGIRFIGAFLPSTGTAIQINSVPTGAYGLDMINSTFSSASIRLDTLSQRGIWFSTDTVGTVSTGIVWGLANDVSIIHAAIGAIRTTGSWRVQGYSCTGCSSAPSNTAIGAISTTKVTPALQAFGDITANAASGVLAFTVSTTAGVCGAAVVTNTNVVAGSEVILTIQKYTGQYITNGTPMVTREDTAGSSVGNFNLNLCNIHTTNALNGNLYIAFWVLN